MATDLERLIVTLEARTKEYERALAKAQGTTMTAMRRVERTMQASARRQQTIWQRYATSVETTLKRLGPALGLTLGAAGFTRLARSARSAIGEVAAIADEASRAGSRIEEMQALIFAVRQEGGDQSALVRSMQRLNEEVGKAMEGTGDLGRRLRDLNIPILDMNGEARKTSAIFLDIADAVKGAKSDQEAAVLVQRALGRGGRELLPFLKQGADTIRETMGLARETGAVISEELVLRAKAFDDAWTASADTLSSKLRAAIVEVVIGMNDAGDATAGFAEITAWLSREIDGVVAGIQMTKREVKALIGFFDDLDARMRRIGEDNDLNIFGDKSLAQLERQKAQVLASIKEMQAEMENLSDTARDLGFGEGLEIDIAAAKAELRRLEQEIARASTSLIGPALEQMGRDGARAFEKGFATAAVSMPRVTHGTGGGSDRVVSGGLASRSQTVSGAGGPVAVTVTRRVEIEPAGIASGVERGNRAVATALDRGITVYDQHGRAFTDAARRTADGVRDIPPGFDRLGDRFHSSLGTQTSALVSALESGFARTAGTTGGGPGVFGGSLGSSSSLTLEPNAGNRARLDALAAERNILQTGLQYRQLSADEQRDAERRIAEIELESAQLSQTMQQTTAAMRTLTPMISQMSQAGESWQKITQAVSMQLGRMLGTSPFTTLPGYLGHGSIPRRADGGPIRGPGGPRSDKVPLWGSNGEFMVNAASTKKHRALIEAINADQLPKLADGGLVGRVNGAAQRLAGGGMVKAAPSGASRREFNVSANINVHGATDADSFRRSGREIARQMAGEIEYAMQERR